MGQSKPSTRAKMIHRLRTAYFVYAAIVALASLGLQELWNRHYQTNLLLIEQHIRDVAANLNSVVRASTNQINALRMEAQAYLRYPDRADPPSPLLKALAPAADFDGFCLDRVPPPDTVQTVANLTGTGSPPIPGTSRAREAELALSLNAQFAAAKHNIPNAAWVYYTSADDMLALYPWVPCSQFRYSKALLENDFYAGGLPQKNPNRAVYWTTAYVDEAGKGVMASLAAPIYDTYGTFHGTVALDVTLDVLSDYVRDPALASGTALIASDDGQLLAHPTLVHSVDKAPKMLADALPGHDAALARVILEKADSKFEEIGGLVVHVVRIDGAPWRFVFFLEHSKLVFSTMANMWVEFLGLALLMTTFVAFEANRRSASALRSHVDELEQTKQDLEHRSAVLDALSQDLARARDEARQANQAKSVLLANVSHELRTPLNAILGFSEVMMQRLFGALGSEKYEEYVKDIHSSGRHLLDIIDDVLDLSKMEVGRRELKERRSVLADIVEDCLQIIGPQAERAGLQVSTAVPPDLPALYVEPRSIKQVFINLLSNAIKFTEPGGRIDLIAIVRPDGDLQIDISDTGEGIPEEHLSHLFTPFARGASTNKGDRQGTGLGLAIVKSLTELHGGKVEIHSTVGTGTVVTVTLPASRLIRNGVAKQG